MKLVSFVEERPVIEQILRRSTLAPLSSSLLESASVSTPAGKKTPNRALLDEIPLASSNHRSRTGRKHYRRQSANQRRPVEMLIVRLWVVAHNHVWLGYYM